MGKMKELYQDVMCDECEIEYFRTVLERADAGELSPQDEEDFDNYIKSQYLRWGLNGLAEYENSS